MTPKQSLTRKQSLIRRSLAVLGAALLAAAWAVGISIPASAAPDRDDLFIVSITDTGSGLGAPVQDRPFDVVVEVHDNAGQLTTVNQETTIILEEVSGPGVLGCQPQPSCVLSAVIPRNGSGATISGATYSQYANGVELRVRAVSGVKLDPALKTVEVALTAVDANASVGTPLDLKDPDCGAPTATAPNCGELLLPKGANGHVIMSVGSCDGLGCLTTDALVVTAIVNLKDADGNPLYRSPEHATLVLACDKNLCRQTANGVPKIPVIYTLENTGRLTTLAPPCSAKDVLGEGEDACVDYVQSSRQQGDLYLYVLFNVDARMSL
jgi:hypothetical protein